MRNIVAFIETPLTIALKFSILSPQSGRSDLARVTRDIVKAKVPSDTINIALVDQWIHGKMNLAHIKPQC